MAQADQQPECYSCHPPNASTEINTKAPVSL
jgi:hypothetical protein